MHEDPLLKRWKILLQTAGVDPSTLQIERCDPNAFGNALATARWGSLVLRLVLDRGQEFIDVSSSTVSKDYFSLDEIGIAFGWSRPEDTVGDFHSKPRPLESELDELGRRRGELELAFSADNWDATVKAIAKARDVRGQVMLKKLRELNPNDFR